MPRTLTSSDILVTRIDDREYVYIKPEIGSFSATRTIRNASYEGREQYDAGKRVILKYGATLIENLEVENQPNGISINKDATARIYDYEYIDSGNRLDGGATGIYRSTSSTGDVEVVRWYADGKDTDAGPRGNTDALDNVGGSGRGETMYIRDFTAKEFYDSGVDVKSDTMIANASISGSRTGLKVWNAELIIVNSDIRADQFVIQLFHPDAKVYFYNTTFNGKSAPALVEIQNVGSFGVPKSAKTTNVIELDENPLPAIDDFFQVDDARYRVQVSVDGGRWIDVAMPNDGFLGSHAGDTLTMLPVQNGGAYRVRAWTEDGGARSAAAEAQYVLKGDDYAPGAAPSAPGSGGGLVPQDRPDPDDGGLVPQDRPDPDDGGSDGDDGEPDSPFDLPDGYNLITTGEATSGGGLLLSGTRRPDLIVTTSGDDVIRSYESADRTDLILFDTSTDIGDDVFADFSRTRDKLLFTEFVDLGADRVYRIDSQGRFDLDDPSLDANGGSIKLSSGLADRYIYYAGETEDGLFLYEIWNRPWSELN